MLPRVRLQACAAVGAAVQAIVFDLVELAGRKRRSLVALVSRLAADMPFAAARGRRLGRFDDVAGGRLGTVGGVLRQAGHLGREFFDLRRELSDEFFQLDDAGLLQPDGFGLLPDDLLVDLFGCWIHGLPTRLINRLSDGRRAKLQSY